VAPKIRENPDLLEMVRGTLQRWVARSDTSPAALAEWQQILDGSTPQEVLSTLLEDSEDGRRRRQSSPFTGILTAAERKAIFDAYEKVGT